MTGWFRQILLSNCVGDAQVISFIISYRSIILATPGASAVTRLHATILAIETLASWSHYASEPIRPHSWSDRAAEKLGTQAQRPSAGYYRLKAHEITRLGSPSAAVRLELLQIGELFGWLVDRVQTASPAPRIRGARARDYRARACRMCDADLTSVTLLPSSARLCGGGALNQ
jgi:hypothetical protein